MFQELLKATQQVRQRLNAVYLGNPQVIEELLVVLIVGSHALLNGPPGVAKTTLVKQLAQALGLSFQRIQFTPDLTPYDILGGEVLVADAEAPTGRALRFAPGPLFASFILADEINRASPRTQSALLEAMQEGQVTLQGVTHHLPHPFFVFATQNPMEHEGTFPLPDAQLDRFFLCINVPYPDFESEVQVALSQPSPQLLPPLEIPPYVWGHPDFSRSFPIAPELAGAAVRLVMATRDPTYSPYIRYGASPRASQALVLGSKALAFLRGKQNVELADILDLAPAVLRHRLVLSFQARSQNLTPDEVIARIIKETVL